MKNRVIAISLVMLFSLIVKPDAIAEEKKGAQLLKYAFRGRPNVTSAFETKLKDRLNKAGILILSPGKEFPKSGDFCLRKDKGDPKKDPLISFAYVCTQTRTVYDIMTDEYYKYALPAAAKGDMLGMEVDPVFECLLSECRSANHYSGELKIPCFYQQGLDGNVACYHLGHAYDPDYLDHICYPLK